MRLPRVRFTVRWLMAVVAAASIGLGLWAGAIRAREMARVAQMSRAKAAQLDRIEQLHRNKAALLRDQAMTLEVSLKQRRENARDERDERKVRRDERIADYRRASARYADRLGDRIRDESRQYQHLADYPWEPFPPDPPRPDPPPKPPF